MSAGWTSEASRLASKTWFSDNSFGIFAMSYRPDRVPAMETHASTARESGDGQVLHRALALFGHTSLRPGQAEVIADIFSGRPVIAVMPTGAGKSLCYQLPAVVLGERGGVTLVVSPLIALMKDQVDTLVGRGIPAVALTSASGADEKSQMLEGIRTGQYTLIYVAPERFRNARFVDALRSIKSSIALVDTTPARSPCASARWIAARSVDSYPER